MSDVLCPTCGEPWDLDCLHDEAEARVSEQPHLSTEAYSKVFDDVRRDFYARGCAALATAYGPGSVCTPRRIDRTAAAMAAYELCGDDLDGAAAMLEDFEMGF